MFRQAKCTLNLAYVAGVGLTDAQIPNQFQYGIRIDRFHRHGVSRYTVERDLSVLGRTHPYAELISRLGNIHDGDSRLRSHHIAQKFVQAVFGLCQDRGWKLKTGENLGGYDGALQRKFCFQDRFPLFQSPIFCHEDFDVHQCGADLGIAFVGCSGDQISFLADRLFRRSQTLEPFSYGRKRLRPDTKFISGLDL